MNDPDGYLDDLDLRFSGDHPDRDVRLALALTEFHMRKDPEGTMRRSEVCDIGVRWGIAGDDPPLADELLALCSRA